MQSVVVLTVVGEDRPGLVHRIASLVSAAGGNWENSELSRLAGMFTGLIQLTVAEGSREELVSSLAQLDGLLDVHVRHAVDTRAADGERFTLDIVGDDHPGIIEDVTATLQRGGATIERLGTTSREAPMSGERIFEARAVVRLDDGAEMEGIETALEGLANDLMIDVTLGAHAPQ